MTILRDALIAALCALAQDAPTPPTGAPDGGAARSPRSGDGAPRVAGPSELTEARGIEVRRRLARVAEELGPNVVRLAIEQRLGADLVVALDATGLVVDSRGHVVTVGSTLAQAGRVAVHFAEATRMRPRRALLLGIDEQTDVGVLSVGPVQLAPPDLAGAAVAEAPPAEQRYVVTLCGGSDSRHGGVAAGWMHEPLRNPTFGQRRFDLLLHVTTTRSPRVAGSVLAQQDGRVVGLTLAPAPGGVPGGGMLALPANALRRGVQSVLARPPPRTDARARAWLGFCATDLDEPQFLRQLGVAGAVVLTEVFEESPALAAELAPNDVILAWDGQPLAGMEALERLVAESSPGRVVALDCVRGLTRRRAEITLGAW